MKHPQPDLVTNGELQGAVMCVVVPVSVFLRLEQTSVYLGEEGVTVGQQSIDGVRAGAALLVRQQGRR